MSSSYKCLTVGLVVRAKDMGLFSLRKLNVMESQLCGTIKGKIKRDEFFLVVYSINPGLMKITAKLLKNKKVEKLTVNTDPKYENEILPLGNYLSEMNIVHTTGFCQVEKKVLYEAYFETNEKVDESKKKIQDFLNSKQNIHFKWETVELYKRFGIF